MSFSVFYTNTHVYPRHVHGSTNICTYTRIWADTQGYTLTRITKLLTKVTLPFFLTLPMAFLESPSSLAPGVMMPGP